MEQRIHFCTTHDGTRIAYVTGYGTLRLYDYGTATDTAIGVTGWSPRWSPDGNWISYNGDGFAPIYVIKPDGSGGHAVGSGAGYEWSFDWSPDSKWIIARAPGNTLEVIQVSSGLRLPLTFTAGLSAPTWKP